VDETVTGLTGQDVSHVFADPGTFTVNVTATDKDGGVSNPASFVIPITTLAVQGNDLAVGGTSGDDVIAVTLGPAAGDVEVTVNNNGPVTFHMTGQLLVFGSAGNDELRVNGTDVNDSAVKTESQIVWQAPRAQTIRWSSIEHTTIDLRAGDDYIVDPGADTAILGGPGNDTIVITATAGGGVVVDGQEGSDTYEIRLGSLAGPVTVNDQGSTGTDTMNVVGTSGNDAIALSGGEVTSGGQTIVFNSSVDNMTVDGGGGDDSVVVSETPVVPLSIEGVTDLVIHGTAGNDRIVFSPGSKPGEIEARLNGAVQGKFTPTGRIVAYGEAGDDDIEVAGSIALSGWLYGGAGNDRRKGGAGDDVLFGGDGDDLLVGRGGRDLLVGGHGADRIVGNADDDILIAGTTAFDANDAALCAIMDEWTSVERGQAERVANLRGLGTGPRLNGDYFLQKGVTVFDDAARDVLTGCAGLDWFLFNDTEDKVTDLGADEFKDVLDYILAAV